MQLCFGDICAQRATGTTKINRLIALTVRTGVEPLLAFLVLVTAPAPDVLKKRAIKLAQTQTK